MTLKANATMTFKTYLVVDGGIQMNFVCLDPGPGETTDYSILLTDTELVAITTQPQLLTLVTAKLNRKLRAANIASKLDPLINQSIVVA